MAANTVPSGQQAGEQAGGSGGVRRVTVEADRDGQRLDNWLIGQLKGAPRSLVYRLLRTGQVRVNGRRAKPDQRLSGGDEVRLPPVRLAEGERTAAPPQRQLDRIAAAIVHEDERLLALDKPSGIAAHGGSGVSHGAIELMRALRPNATLELVHRLDRDTSGILLIAKTRAALSQLQRLMREGGMDKTYLALLVGRLSGERFRVDVPLEKSRLQGGERMVRVGEGGKDSLSDFRVLERRGGHTLAEVRIGTGRTHQIRVHAAHLGHPVAGDDKYGDRDANRRLRDKAGLKRMFLHAAALGFALDEGQRPYLISAPLPAELSGVLDALSGTRRSDTPETK